MGSSRNLSFMSIKTWIILLFLSFSTSNSESQKGTPLAGLLCVSDCDTCPVVCTPPPSPPPRSHHHSPPESYSTPPAHPAPAEGKAVPPPPALYVYTPEAPGMVQQNFSYPYYYFYASKAAECSLPLHLGFIVFVLFVFSQVWL